MGTTSRILWLDTVESTNSALAAQVFSLDNLSVIAARFQTAGRGQGDHRWHSRAGENLTFSALLCYGPSTAPLAAADALVITHTASLALRRFLAGQGIPARIKWHNDIYVGDRKIAGMLIENKLDGAMITRSIVGIGLNVNQTEFPADLPNPTSLALQTGKRYDVEQTLDAFLPYLREAFEQSCTPEGRVVLREEFEKYLFYKV
ncbi:MAG: biotin--[acetyl-CoA-carboxylase] ligase [Bacteroidales bacterium]|nr:biotin--[acetyl-CoA-carboxylase] ligase [Bacteroidales bacterium]